MAYDEFKALFRSSNRAWHLELKDTYNVQVEDEPFGRFLSGEPDDYSWLREWLGFIRAVTESGIIVQRVRVVTFPHSDYIRWGLALASQHVEAGEDVRYLRRDITGGIEFPQEDCWLFDDDTLVLSIFSEDGRTGGFAREPDPDLTTRYRVVRDQVWPRAVPQAEYVASTL
jgi:hypothetical protein